MPLSRTRDELVAMCQRLEATSSGADHAPSRLLVWTLAVECLPWVRDVSVTNV